MDADGVIVGSALIDAYAGAPGKSRRARSRAGGGAYRQRGAERADDVAGDDADAALARRLVPARPCQ